MGYTHYFSVDRTHPLLTELIAADVATMAVLCEIPLAGPDGQPDTQPIINGDTIRFNGMAPDHCEWFIYPPDPAVNPHVDEDPDYLSDLVKTLRMPYDIVAAAALLSIKHHHGSIASIASDGTPGIDDEWDKAIYLFHAAFPDRDVTSILGDLIPNTLFNPPRYPTRPLKYNADIALPPPPDPSS